MISKKIFLFIVSMIFTFIHSHSYAQSDNTLTITTYYPAPFGVYKELRTKRMAIGDNYYKSSDYSWGVDIDSNADLVIEGNVGIGTTDTGSFKLYVEGKARTDTPLASDPDDTVATKGYVDAQVETIKPVFVKCQVKHSSFPVYPKCPPGWHDIHHYAMAPVTSGYSQQPGTALGVSIGMDNMDTKDGTWWYLPEWTEDPPGCKYYKKQSTLCCTVCQQD